MKKINEVTMVLSTMFNIDTPISDVINDPTFSKYGHLLFPTNHNYISGRALKELKLKLYTHINPQKTVEILNYLKQQVLDGKQIFFNVYTDEEKERDASKKDTGIFFFRGKKNSKFAILNAGGGFLYVAAIHDSFPHALELSKKGYNSFALIYRNGRQNACEDLARTIAFLYKQSDFFQIDTNGYSLWGGSAGGRMAAWLGAYGTQTFNEKEYPPPSAVIIQYNSIGDVTGFEAPTYCCVGDNDAVVDYRAVEDYISKVKQNGINAMVDVFPGLEHGFGLGEGTKAEGWIDRAVKFWELQTNK